MSWCSLWMLLAYTCAYAACQQPTHIVFIMADDMGWNDVSFHGSDQIQTPNIDTLAYQGIILQQYYSEPVCTPARSALLTGKYPMRIAMQGRPLRNAETRGIPLSERLLPAYLKDLGYSTHLVGKWHVGMSREGFLPTARGYDTHYGYRGGFIDYYTYSKIEPGVNSTPWSGRDLFDNNVPQDDEERYSVDVFTERAVNIINEHDTSKPLFLHLSHNAPHCGNNGALLQTPSLKLGNEHIANTDRRHYAEIVNHLDLSVGRVIKALEEKQMLNETIIIFMSDNGAPTVGEFSNWGINLPFRGIKETPWEGALRVPALIWHSSVKSGIWDGFMHITDWLPTLVAAVGGEVTTEIDGVSQWNSIIQGGESNRTEALLSRSGGSNNDYAAFRSGDHKIIVGNLTGLRSDYYGAAFLANRTSPPDYFSALKSCDVWNVFTNMGKELNYDQVTASRQATLIRLLDSDVDPTLCVPTSDKGCLFNVRQDPEERHDLWDEKREIANQLTSRLQELLALEVKRAVSVADPAANPANFGYRWMPWIAESQITTVSLISNK